MGYKASLDIVICLEAMKTKLFRRVGRLRYRISLFHEQNKQKIFCRPYNILRSKNNNFSSQNQSQLCKASQYYYSKIHYIGYHDAVYLQQESCYFRSYINAENINHQQFICKVQLMLSLDHETSFKTIANFEATIRKSHNLSAYLPICFDQFQGFTIGATYHASLFQFKFQSQFINTEAQICDFTDFRSYFDAITHQFKKNKTVEFYQYYRTILQQQLDGIQKKHTYLIQLNNLKQNYQYLRYYPNKKIQYLLNNLSKNLNYQLKQQLIQLILSQFLQLKACIYQKWNQFIKFITYNNITITKYYQNIYLDIQKDRLKINVFSHKISNSDWTQSKYHDSGKNNIEHAQLEKNKNRDKQLWGHHFPIQNIRFFGDQKKSIKIFQERYIVYKEQITQRSDRSDWKIALTVKKDHSPNLRRKSKNKTTIQDNQYIKMYSQHQKLSLAQSPLLHHRAPLTLSTVKNTQKKSHIIVLVHGLQASRQDFFLIKSCLQIRFGIQVMVSSANQGRTQDSLQIQGKRLALQIINFLAQREDDYKLSFIGHSLGGLIIRSALTFLQKIHDKLYTYVSMSSPHLGYLYSASTLVQAGLWLLNTWHKVDSLQQLCMRDSNNLRQCYLFKLSKQPTLINFQKLVFIASSQDQYTPYESTRIQKNMKLLQQSFGFNSLKSQIICEMVDNILGRVKSQQISRMNVIFDIEDKNLDSWIGRTAHVKFLSDRDFIKKFFIGFQQFFKLS